MKESYWEGLASHPDPESWASTRKGTGQALTGAHTGEVLSHEIDTIGEPTRSDYSEGNTSSLANAMRKLVSTGSEALCTYGNFLPGNREIPSSTSLDGNEARAMNPKGARSR